MILGIVADDFTGATDIASTLASSPYAGYGIRTTQFIGVPESSADETNCDAGVIALKSRSISPRLAVEQSLRAVTWLREQGCRQIIFKYCSTFDSTRFGNIGPVA